MNKQSNGVTLIEILIGLVISAAIFLVATNLITSLFGSSTKQKQLETLEQTKNDLQSDIGNNVKWSEESVSFVDGVLRVDDDVYELIDGVVYKNSIPLTSEDVYVDSLNVSKYSSSNVPTELLKGIGLTGRYFNTADFSDFVFDQIDPTIEFDWDTDSPDERVDSDTFSVRWTGQIETPESGEYRFRVQSNDGVRLYIDDELIVDDWSDGSSTSIGRISLDGERRYNVILEYYENQGRANIALYWSHYSFGQELVPSRRLYPTALQSTIEVEITMYHANEPDIKDTVGVVVSPRSGGVIGSIQTIVTPTPSVTDNPNESPTPTNGISTPTPTVRGGGSTGTPQPTRPPTTDTPTPKPLR